MLTTHNAMDRGLNDMEREFEKGHLGAHRSKYRKIRVILARMREAQTKRPSLHEVCSYFTVWLGGLVRRIIRKEVGCNG